MRLLTSWSDYRRFSVEAGHNMTEIIGDGQKHSRHKDHADDVLAAGRFFGRFETCARPW